jgi:hypothetical protein
MKPRAVTLALALAAFGLFYALLFPKPIAILEPTSLPLSTDGGEDGLLATWRWLQAEAIPVLSLRHRYDHFGSTSLGGTGAGNVLISVMPQRLAARAEEWQPLARWIEQGNTLLVLAALDDTPRWTLGSDSSFLMQLQRATGMTFAVKSAQTSKPSTTQQVEDSLNALLGPTVIPIIPRGAHALLSEVRNLRAVSDLPASRWRAEPLNGSTPLALAQRADNLDPVLWLMRQGEGQVIVFAAAPIVR